MSRSRLFTAIAMVEIQLGHCVGRLS
jgi:hypothetical protein